MSLIMELPQIMEEGFREFEALLGSPESSDFLRTEQWGKGPDENFLVRGENAAFMKYLLTEKELAGKVDLIYMDPPFFSKSDYGAEIKLQSDGSRKIPVMRQPAYKDTWEKGMAEYLRMLTVRFLLMRELLSDTGSIWVHLDWHGVHYVKIIMDEIFGPKNFINEVIWQYKSGGVSKRHFARKHDTLLFYAKTPRYYFQPRQEKSYNRGFKPYRFKGVKEYRDEQGWYTMVNRKDVWQLDMVGRTSAERTGYVTQKPESLMERILDSCTPEGGLCADFFGGSGTLAAAANKMGRKWITCDVGKLAAINAHKRLLQAGASYNFYEEVSPGEEPSSGRLLAKVSLEPEALSDRLRLRAELTGYELADYRSVPVEAKFLPVIREVLKQDSLQLVDYWSVDYRYDGRVFRPQIYFCKERERIQAVYETLGPDFGRIAIRAVDIFGNTAFFEQSP